MMMMLIMMMLSFLSQVTMSQPGLDNGTTQNSWQSLHQSRQRAAGKEKILGNSLDFPTVAAQRVLWKGGGAQGEPCCSNQNNTRTNHKTMCIQIKNVYHSVPPSCPVLQVIGPKRNLAQTGLVWSGLFCLLSVT